MVQEREPALDGVGHQHPVALRRQQVARQEGSRPVSYTHLRAHETVLDLVCRLLLEKKNKLRELIIRC